MGNTIDTKLKPVVMTTDFVNEKILLDAAKVEDLNVSELRKLLIVDVIDSDLVLSLNLEHQGLLNISSLWRFSLLTKLELANNFIETIESLEGLPNLQCLDLSFNCIKTIKGLNDLSKVLYLNLSFNEITLLENMEHMTKLESFLVRSNKIKSFDNIHYLMQFKYLLCVGVEGNPLSSHENIRIQIIAVLPQLQFLDFQMVTERELQKALLTSQSSSKNNFGNAHSFNNISAHTSDFSSLWKIDTPDKTAFVEDLANGQAFKSFLMYDKNFRALYSYPPVADIAENYLQVSKVFDRWHDKGHEYYNQMQKEKAEFTKMVKEVQNFSLSLIKEECEKYVNVKEEIPKDLCILYQRRISSEQIDLIVQELKEKYIKEIKNTHTNLTNASCMCIDLVYKLEQTFETEMLKIKKNYMEEIQQFYEDIMKIDDIYISELQDFYADIFDTGSNFDIEFGNQFKEVQLESVFSQLLTRKDYVEMALTMAKTIHSTLLQERIKKLESSLENFKFDTQNKSLEIILVKQNEVTRDIVIFCSKQMYIIDKLFSTTLKHYLG